MELLRPGDDIEKAGVKFDAGKLRWSLLPWEAITGVLRIIEYGAIKYAPRNWERGLDWSRCYDAAMRHIDAWWRREENDPDTGMSHLWHAATNIIFLITYQIRGVGKDDRP